MWTLLGNLLGGLLRMLPFIGAYFAGKKVERLDTAEKQVETHEDVQNIEDKVRRMSDARIDRGLSE